MRTGDDVKEFGLYASECCLHESVFEKDDSFSRCPDCMKLCRWEQVEAPASLRRPVQLQGTGDYEAA